MIEKMKKVIVVAPLDRKREMLNAIRDFGVVHISETAAPESKYSERLFIGQDAFRPCRAAKG